MSRIRTIKPEFWTSTQVVECSPCARLLFVGIWNFSDDGGIHPACISRLKMEIFPSDAFTKDQMQIMVNELLSQKLIHQYEVNGEMFWQISGWHHQKIDQPTFKFPWPDGKIPNSPNKRRMFAEQTPNVRRADGERSPQEGKGRESKGMEGKGEEKEVTVKDTQLLVLGETPTEAPPGQETATPKKPKPIMPNCPHEEIVALYHETLPMCMQMREWNDTRRGYLQARWRGDAIRQNLKWWKEFFDYIRKSKFLIGEKPGKDGGPPFCADLEWIVRPMNFAKITEGKYHRDLTT